MKVYVVTSGEDYLYDIDSIYSTKEKAEKYIKREGTIFYNEIQEWEVDKESYYDSYEPK